MTLESIHRYCMAKPGAWEDAPWGRIVRKVGTKRFAISGHELPLRLTVKSTLEKRASLIQHPAIEVASHVGRYGWVTITLKDLATCELARDLIDESYDAVVDKSRRRFAPQ